MKCGPKVPEVRTSCVLNTARRSHASRWVPIGCQDAHNTRSVVALSERVVGFNASACRQCAIHCRSTQKDIVSKFPSVHVEIGCTLRLAIYGPQHAMLKSGPKFERSVLNTARCSQATRCGPKFERSVLNTARRSHASRWMLVGCQDVHNTGRSVHSPRGLSGSMLLLAASVRSDPGIMASRVRQ